MVKQHVAVGCCDKDTSRAKITHRPSTLTFDLQTNLYKCSVDYFFEDKNPPAACEVAVIIKNRLKFDAKPDRGSTDFDPHRTRTLNSSTADMHL